MGISSGNNSRSTSSGAGCLTLFGLIFAGFGVFAIYEAIAKQASHPQNLWVGYFVGGVFLLIGLGIVVGSVFAGKYAKTAANLRRQYPDEPWRCKPQWADGVIKDSNKTAVISLWAFGIVWNLIGDPSGVMAANDAIAHHKYVGLIALLFPLVGIGFLIAAIRQTDRYLKFGVSALELKTFPGFIGSRFSGMIRTAVRLDSIDGVRLRICCIRRVTTGNGKSQSTSETIEWEAEQTLRPALPGDGAHTEIPVSFDLPPGGLPTDDSNPRRVLFWRLEATAKMTGIGYVSKFVVPVYQPRDAADLPAAAATPDIAEPYREKVAMHEPSDPGIILTPQSGGGRQFYFGRARNKGVAVMVTIFFLAFGAIAVGTYYGGAGWIFTIPFGLVAFFLFWGMLNVWLSSSTINVDKHRIIVEKGFAPLRTTREFSADEVRQIDYQSTLQAGNTAYYSIRLHIGAPNPFIAASGMTQRDADWIVGEMRNAMQKNFFATDKKADEHR